MGTLFVSDESIRAPWMPLGLSVLRSLARRRTSDPRTSRIVTRSAFAAMRDRDSLFVHERECRV